MYLTFFALLLALANSSDTQDFTQWKQSVEHVIQTVVVGPLGEHFTPEYLRKRTRTQVLSAQKNRLRARIATAMIESANSEEIVCPFLQMHTDTINEVVQEFKNRTFSIRWINDYHSMRCPGCHGFIHVDVPEPTNE